MDTEAVNGVVAYDVPQRRLELAGVTLSRRMENGKGVWRLEAPRLEGEEPLVVEQLGGPVTPPRDVTAVLPAFLRGSSVEQVQPRAEPMAIDEPTDPIERLRTMLEQQYAQILLHDPGVRLDLDPEDVHRVRVAARRARAVLRAARPLLDAEWSEPLREELKWLGGSLGRRRDVDVLIAHLDGEIEQLEQPERDAAASLVQGLGDERTTAQVVALDTLQSSRYYRLLDALEEAVRGPRVRRGQVSLKELAQSEFQRLSRIAKRLGPDSSDDALHRARIAGKRARYTAELAEDEMGKPARRLIERAKELQDLLGAHQDAIVAEARLRGLLADAPGSGAAFAAGRLVERERARQRDARAELPKAWRRLDRAARSAFE